MTRQHLCKLPGQANDDWAEADIHWHLLLGRNAANIFQLQEKREKKEKRNLVNH